MVKLHKEIAFIEGVFCTRGQPVYFLSSISLSPHVTLVRRCEAYVKFSHELIVF